MPQELPTSIRLSRALRRDLVDAARQERRTLSAQIVYILMTWINWRHAQKPGEKK